ncbi:MAG: cytochrome ubiquinol oxidase subunit I [Firmicutes bacterium]|nr:cytochrome ubiquinol oxidase subunit I [Bacillota bacterium]
MGLSLGFHIPFATAGVGVPAIITLAEISAAITKDRDYRDLAQRLASVFAVLLAVGVVSGTIVAVQLTLLWPRFMQLVGEIISLPFLIEVFAFFIEAVFTAIYLYGGDRLAAWQRILSAGLVSLGAVASAVLITDANAFMNTPVGFTLRDGHVVDAHPWQAFFNPAFPSTAFHVAVSAYMTIGMAVAAFAAFNLLWARKHTRAFGYYRKTMMLSIAFGGIMAIATAIAGDLQGKFLGGHQPVKLAAAEGFFHTQTHAPMVIGGWPDATSQQVIGGIPIPGLLSYLATGSPSGLVRGLADFPRWQWPPLYVHLLFDAMVGVGIYAIAVAIVAWVVRRFRRSREDPFPHWVLWLVVAAGPLALLGIEFGWVFAEIARQPWIVYGIMQTADAATTNPAVPWVGVLFVLLYIVLAVATIRVLRRYLRRHPLKDAEAPEEQPKREVWLP